MANGFQRHVFVEMQVPPFKHDGLQLAKRMNIELKEVKKASNT